MHLRRTSTLLVVALAAGCGQDGGPSIEGSGTLSLLDADPRADWAPVGVAFDAASDRLLVLDAWQGITVLDPEGALVERIVVDRPIGDAALTDIAITGDTISLLSDLAGYRLDETDGSLQEYFCLEPAPDPDPQDPEPQACTYHQSGGLTFQGGSDLVVAAPYHLDCLTDEPLQTVLEAFATSTGEVAWQIRLPRTVLFGGLAWDPDSALYFAGSGSEIVTIDPISGRTEDTDIDSSAVEDIQGLALDAVRRRLWVLDAASRQLVRFDL